MGEGTIMKYELLEDEPQEATAFGNIARTVGRTAARGLEAAIGLPGDIVAGGVNAASYLSGGRIPTHEQLVQKDIKRGVSPYLQLPTSEKAREVTKALTGETLEPQSAGEKFYDDIISDATTLLLGGVGKGASLIGKVGRALGTSTAGNVSQWATESLTGSPVAGIAAKMGSIALAGTVGGRKKIESLKEQSYKDAYANLPKNRRYTFKKEQSQIDSMISKLNKGDAPDKNFLIDRLRSVGNIKNDAGTATMRDAINLKKDWNKYLADPSLSKSSRDMLKRGVGILNSGISKYASKYPKFLEPYRVGEELTAALQSNNYIQKFISQHPTLQNSIKNPLVKSLMWGGVGYGVKSLTLPHAAGIGTGVLATRSAARAYQLLTKSPVARKYYADAIKASLKNKVGTAAKNFAKLDKVFTELDSENQESGMPRAQYELLED